MSQAELVSECFVRPEIEMDECKRIHHLNPFDLRLLLIVYSQLGFLIIKPSNFSPFSYYEILRNSLSKALVHFYPLAGQLVTVPNHADHSCCIHVECSKGLGARLIHASAHNLTMLQVSRPNLDVLKVINHDGRTRPLLSVQVTEIHDGVYLGPYFKDSFIQYTLCFNHSIVDGISAFHFLRVWSRIFMGTLSSSIPLPLLENPLFCKGGSSSFHTLTRMSLSTEILKVMANSDATVCKMITTFEALIAFVWKSITRARKLPSNELTTIALPINLRLRFKPPLMNNYFGNYLLKARASTKVGYLLNNNVGWAATLVQQAVAAQDDTAAREFVERTLDKGIELVPSTQTFWWLFEWGDGSVDLDICIAPQAMCDLLLDQRFMSFTSLHNAHFNLISKL
ncbi:hypothetical protein RND81_02G207200 [Saponaria officinalis]|uniref:Uncharacterized protein n=1 Tax=Saponaria officinalis TaxID=3572 RepID=A0AAW1MV37_SAPOF